MRINDNGRIEDEISEIAEEKKYLSLSTLLNA